MLFALTILWLLLPLRTSVKIGADEDFELAKPVMAWSGYNMYTQVWDDQPPLYTFLIVQALRHFSFSVIWPRLITEAFAVLLVVSVFSLLARARGLWLGFAGALLVVASPGFVELSASCMQEIPALAPVATSLCLLAVAGRPRWCIVELAAGLVFAVGLQLKYIGFVYLPLVVLLLWGRSRSDAAPVRSTVVSLGVFAFSAVLGFLGINLVTGSPLLLQLEQSWSAHFANGRSAEYGSPADHPFDWLVLLKNWDVTVPAAVGMFFLLPEAWRFLCESWRCVTARADCRWEMGDGRVADGRWEMEDGQSRGAFAALLVGWVLLTLVVFSLHKPWWQYYYIHSAVPLCLCAAVGMVEAWRRLRRGLAGPGTVGTPSTASPISPRRQGSGRKEMGPGGTGPYRGALVGAFSTASPISPRRQGGGRKEMGPGGTGPYRKRRRTQFVRVAFGVYLVVAGAWMAARVYLQVSGIRSSPKIYASLVLKEIERFKPFTKFIFTDQPVYSFHARIPMPPSLGIMSLKRFWTGDMTNEGLVAELKEIKPGLILLASSTKEVPYQDLLNREYRLVYQDGANSLYAHRSIAGKARY